MNYEEALALMKTAKNPIKGKPIANNTRLYVCLNIINLSLINNN